MFINPKLINDIENNKHRFTIYYLRLRRNIDNKHKYLHKMRIKKTIPVFQNNNKRRQKTRFYLKALTLRYGGDSNCSFDACSSDDGRHTGFLV